MAKKISQWTPKGMNQDFSVSKFNPEFAFENMNLRLSTNEGNTLLSWVNEKGTKEIYSIAIYKRNDSIWEKEVESSIQGIAIGTAVINNQLVLFTTSSDEKPDRIYVVEKNTGEQFSNEHSDYICKLLYNGNLGFDITYPIESIVSYEREDIQKVYWTDGKNQPRIINIKMNDEDIDNLEDTSFDFVPTVKGISSIWAEKRLTGGTFPAGVIQYCFSYVDNGRESNLIDISPLYYLTHDNRGAAADETVSNSFAISIKNVLPEFKYVRLYSIQRTSIDGTPIAKLLTTIETENYKEKKEISGNTEYSEAYDFPLYDNENPDFIEEVSFSLSNINNDTKEVSFSIDKKYQELEGEYTVAEIIDDLNQVLDGTKSEEEPSEIWQDDSQGINAEFKDVYGVYLKDNNKKDNGEYWSVTPKYEYYYLKTSYQDTDSIWIRGTYMMPYKRGFRRDTNLSVITTYSSIRLSGNGGTVPYEYEGFLTESSHLNGVSVQSLLYYIRLIQNYLISHDYDKYYLSEEEGVQIETVKVKLSVNYHDYSAEDTSDGTEELKLIDTSTNTCCIPWNRKEDYIGGLTYYTANINSDGVGFPGNDTDCVFTLYFNAKRENNTLERYVFERLEVENNQLIDISTAIPSMGIIDVSSLTIDAVDSGITTTIIEADNDYNTKIIGSNWEEDFDNYGEVIGNLTETLSTEPETFPTGGSDGTLIIPNLVNNNNVQDQGYIFVYFKYNSAGGYNGLSWAHINGIDVEVDRDLDFSIASATEDALVAKIYIPDATKAANIKNNGVTIGGRGITILEVDLKYQGVVFNDDSDFANWRVKVKASSTYFSNHKVKCNEKYSSNGYTYDNPFVVEPSSLIYDSDANLYTWIYNDKKYKGLQAINPDIFVLDDSEDSQSEGVYGFYYLQAKNESVSNSNCIGEGGWFLNTITVKLEDTEDKTSYYKTIDLSQIAAFAEEGDNKQKNVVIDFDILGAIIYAPDNGGSYVKEHDLMSKRNDCDDYLYSYKYITEVIKEITFTDNGVMGSSIDPTSLLFIGGHAVKAYTMAEKDNTLFLGNIQTEMPSVLPIQEYYLGLSKNALPNVTFDNYTDKLLTQTEPISSFYNYEPQLKEGSDRITTFKGGETYRFGYQLQTYTGEWSDPIFIGDKENTKYPKEGIKENTTTLVSAKADINIDAVKDEVTDFDKKFQNIRPVIVYPDNNSRTVLCQGVLNPTVFKVRNRVDNNGAFSQASWFFRPYSFSGTKDWEGYTANKEDQYTRSWNVDENIFTMLYGTYSEERYKRVLKAVYLEIGYNIKGIFPLGRRELKCYDGQNRELYWAILIIEKPSDRNPFLTTDLTLICKNDNSIYIYINAGDVQGGYENYIVGYNPQYPLPSLNDLSNALDTNVFVTKEYIEYYIPILKGNEFQYSFYYRMASQTAWSSAYNILQSTHYTNLRAYYDCSPDDNRMYYRLGEVEIQGSCNAYKYWYEKQPMANHPYDAQFMVDQSIVTLNSPDLEFDSTLSSWNFGDCKLRVVGMIPINGYASSHKIDASASVPDNYNTSGDHNIPARELSNYGRENGYHYSNGRVIAYPYWNDSIGIRIDDYKVVTRSGFETYVMYPWHSQNLTNMNRDNISVLNTKKFSHYLYSAGTRYCENYSSNIIDYPKIEVGVHLKENQHVYAKSLSGQYNSQDVNLYYPNVNEWLNMSKWGYYHHTSNESQDVLGNVKALGKDYCSIQMSYKSNTHAVISIKGTSEDLGSYGLYENVVRTMPSGKFGGIYIGAYNNIKNIESAWNRVCKFWSYSIDINSMLPSPYITDYLWIGELYRDNVQNRFGGDTLEALRQNNWSVAGETVSLFEGDTLKSAVTLYWTEGDTYYQRYDCLKTYAFSDADKNQNVEILSFMCESRINIDGVTSKMRGQQDSYDRNPTNFNQINPVYSQRNNFFNTKGVYSESEVTKYPNDIWYSETKTPGADVDAYTKVTMASILDLDGDKGEINALRRFNDQIFAFQDTGISQILYNENVQISSTAGVPIEIANSGKVQGKRYLSDTIGCSNKWSIASTPSGLYFMDSYGKDIYLFNGQLANISGTLGFSTWCKNNIPAPSIKWNPKEFDNFTAQYDKLNQEVHFINKDKSLVFSEKLKAFTSFYNYGHTPFFNMVGEVPIWTRSSGSITKLWQHLAGDYNNFFGTNYPYWMTLIGNPEPVTDKIFTNLEFRANVDGEGTVTEGKYSPTLPFDSLEAWDEYQHGELDLSLRNSSADRLHSSLQRKFRMWRCDVPRDNFKFETYPTREQGETDEEYQEKVDAYNAWLKDETDRGIFRTGRHINDRMRNPWIYLKLTKDAATDNNTLPRAEIHDLVMTYYN